ELVCEVKFSEWTKDQHMRIPIFLGLRDDKDPRQCVFEPVRAAARAVEAVEATTSSQRKKVARKAAGRTGSVESPMSPAKEVFQSGRLEGDREVTVDHQTVALTHLDKVYWPEEGYTKGDLLKYYFDIADYILPYLKDRPLILKRYPNGIGGKFF